MGPTRKSPDMESLGREERMLYELVSRSYLAAHLPDAISFRTTIKAVIPTPVGPKAFVASGSVPKSAGWRAAIEQEDDYVPGRSSDKGSDGRVADVENGAAASSVR